MGSLGSQNYDNLLASGEYITKEVTILTGQNVVRGAVMGKVTASGKYILSLAAAVDGSETPDVIMFEDVDASAADKKGLVLVKAEVSEGSLTLGTGHTADSIYDALRLRSIFIKKDI